MTVGGTFSMQVRNFAEVHVPRQVEKIVKEAFRDTMRDANTPVTMGGAYMPYKTGRLAGSLSVAMNHPPRIIVGVRSWSAWEREVGAYRMGDVIWAEWTAEYAVHVEYGHDGIAGAGFYRLAMQRWSFHVAENEKKYGDR